MASTPVYEPFIQEFTNQSSITVSHMFGRRVNVAVYEGSEEVIAKVYEDSIDPLNKITVEFYENEIASQKTGKIVVS